MSGKKMYTKQIYGVFVDGVFYRALQNANKLQAIAYARKAEKTFPNSVTLYHMAKVNIHKNE